MVLEIVKLLISLVALLLVGFLANKSLDTSNEVSVVVYIIFGIVTLSWLKISKDSIISILEAYKIFKSKD